MSEPSLPPDDRYADPEARPATWLDRVSLLGLRLVAGLLGLLGIDRASALMGFFWRRLAPFGKRHRRADRHLQRAIPALSDHERRAILLAMWENLGRTTAETLLLPTLIKDLDRFELATEALEPHREDLKKGAIFASLHQGNWELCGFGIRLAGFKVAAVYKALSNPLAEEFLYSRRLPIYDGGLYAKQAASAFRLRSLARQGVAIGMLADFRDATGYRMPFFGYDTFAASFPVVLARRLGLPLIAGRVIRTTGAHFRIEALRIDLARTASAEADIEAGTAALNRQFESWIAEIPQQWMWAHRKWTDS